MTMHAHGAVNMNDSYLPCEPTVHIMLFSCLF